MPSDVVRAPGHSRARSLGWLAVRWIEHFCIHGPGDIQGTPLDPKMPGAIPLSDELVMLTVDSYALDKDGRRLYDSVFYSRPKGADKSGHLSRVSLFEALGPCRFGGWAEGGEVFEWMDFRHRYEKGEPMGQRITYPFIRLMATEEGQVGNVYDAVYSNLSDGPLREAFHRKDDIGLTRIYLPDPYGGEVRPSTASSSAKDGGKETFVGFDETHLYTTPELKRMYQTVRRNLAKRKVAEPWSGETSTMYEPGRESVAEASHALAHRIRDGKERRPRMLFDHRYAPMDTNIDDEESLLKGLREAYGDASGYMDFERIISEFYDPRNDPEDEARFFLNQVRHKTGRAFDLERWKQNVRRDYVVEPGALITLGFDGSVNEDSTALVGTEVSTGYQWIVGLWEKPEHDPGWEVPKEDVDATVEEAFATWNVWRMYCDPSKWESYLAQWAGRHGEKVVVAWSTVLYRKMATALKAYAGGIYAGEVTHDGDRRFERHIANSIKKPMNFRDDDGSPLWLIQKDRPQSPNKIDAAMAGCLSWAARTAAIASGMLNEPEEEEAGVFFV